MMEWYQAYTSMQDQMDLTQDIILNAAEAADCGTDLEWDNVKINLGNFNQSTLSDLVIEHNNELTKDDLTEQKKLEEFLNNKEN